MYPRKAMGRWKQGTLCGLGPSYFPWDFFEGPVRSSSLGMARLYRKKGDPVSSGPIIEADSGKGEKGLA